VDAARDWIDKYAEAVGVPAPSAADVETLLSLAGIAAHASVRQAAPITCWLAAVAGLSPKDAERAAQDLAKRTRNTSV
jgi:hypothetical protein